MIDVRIRLDLSVQEASSLELALHERQKKLHQRKAERFFCDLDISYEEETIRTLEDIKTKIVAGVYDAGEGGGWCSRCGRKAEIRKRGLCGQCAFECLLQCPRCTQWFWREEMDDGACVHCATLRSDEQSTKTVRIKQFCTNCFAETDQTIKGVCKLCAGEDE